MHLLIEYYQSHDRRRNAEFLLALHENLGLDEITRIHLFVETDSCLHFSSPKLQIAQCGNRPTFNDFFSYCKKHLKGKHCIIANSDILFNNTLQIAKRICQENVVLALSRWEIDYSGNAFQYRLFDNAASQDSWIFIAPIRSNEKMNFCLGAPGSDNRIAKLLEEQGYVVKNPAKRIHTFHFHSRFSNTPQITERIPGPYLLVSPTSELHSQPKSIVVAGFDELGNVVLP